LKLQHSSGQILAWAYLRTGDQLPASFTVPIIREERKPKLVASYGSTKVAEFAASRNRRRNRA
jgi:hypothetical protein